MNQVLAHIGIGSNLNNSTAIVYQAFKALARIPLTSCVARSRLYRSEPIGPPQPDYINAVASLKTALSEDDLLTALQAIEHLFGRQRGMRWGPRTLDLDLLLYGNLIKNDPHLTIPHPRLQERAFVLYPLRDIAPNLVVPQLGDLQTLLQRCPPLKLQQLESQA